MAREGLKAHSKRRRTFGEMFQLHDPSYPHKDRATVLLQCSSLEHALQDAILSKFVPLTNDDHSRLLEHDNPLATFSAKIKIGFALGLYGPQTRADLNCIRDIRNAFAHAVAPLSFKTPEVIAACMQLKARPPEPEWTASAEMRYGGATGQIGMDLLKVGQANLRVSEPPTLP